MSPIAAPPARGFADFQRTGPWDSGTLYDDPGTNLNGPASTGVLDVSRFAYLCGYDLALVLPVKVVASWSDPSNSIGTTGQRVFTLSPNVQNFAQWRLLNLGPAVEVTWTPLGGAAWNHTAAVFASNRDAPLEMAPIEPVVIDQDTVAIGAASTATVYPTDYYAGPVQVAVHAADAMTLILDYLNPAGVWRQFYVLTLPAGGWQNVTALVPEGAWRARVTNAGGASTYDLKIVPSLTGGT